MISSNYEKTRFMSGPTQERLDWKFGGYELLTYANAELHESLKVI